MILIDIAAGALSIDLGARGPNFSTVSACAAAADAIGQAFRIIQRGDAQVMIAGGSEATIAPLGIGLFDQLGALCRRNETPQAVPQPFDKERDGLVMGEGAAMLVLEESEFARARGAHILAEIVGYSATADSTHITAPDPQGAGGAKAMARALADAGLSPDQVDYINAHGTATELNDQIETAAIKTVFGEHAYRLAVSSTKSMTGHMMGATGAVEALVCVRAVSDGVIPPTINYHTPDPACDLDCVPNKARRQPVRLAISNSFGFGGHNNTLAFKSYEQ
jgi:3-oxoacyl-[acyl-carrier-protein] synthase II